MKSKRAILVSGLAAIVVAVLFLVIAVHTGRPTNSPSASVSFLGFTNVPSKGRYAVLSITNASTVPNGFLVDSFEESINGVWTRRGLTNAAGLTSQARQWLRGYLGWQDSLAPGRSAVIYVPMPVTD